jgi:hypothetical protein
MGKIVLLGIVISAIWAGFLLHSSWKRQFGSKEASPATETKDKAPVPRVRPREPERPSAAVESLAVLASSDEWVFIEAWGLVRPGEELPGGQTLLSWSAVSALVKLDGKVHQIRFRRVGEALALAVKPVSSDPWRNPAAGPQSPLLPSSR